MAASAADAGARAIGADADVGFAWSGRRRWCRRRSSAASYRVIDNDRKFRSTDSGALSAFTMFAALTRAREARRFQPLSDADRPAPAGCGGAAAAGRRRHFFLAELLLAASGRTMELGRSAPMLTSASPVGAAAVPAPVERSELPGHRQRSQIPQHRQWGALLARSGLAGKISGIWQRYISALTRAREAGGRFQRPARPPTDLHRPAAARCGRGGRRRHFFLAELLLAASGRTMELGRSAPMLTSASPGRGGGDGGAGRAQRATGSSTTIANSAAPTVGRSCLAQAAGCGSNARARGGGRFQPICVDRRPTCTGRLGGAAAAGRRRHFFLAELLLADSGRTLELGRSAPMLTSASPGRGARPAPVERSELPGHRQRSQIPQHLRWQRSPCSLP